MYVLDDRFSTAVAFVEGFNTALDGAPLSDFNRYVATCILNRQSNFHWSYVVASTKMPAILDGGIRIDQIPAEMDADLTEKMVSLLEGYQAETSSSDLSS